MLCQGAEGVNFSQPRTAGQLERYNRREALVCRRYNLVYGLFGGDEGAAPDLSQGNIRGPIFSILKKRIAAVQGLYNPADYNLSKNHTGAFVVNLEPELVFIKENGPQPVPLAESELFRRLSRI